MALFAAGPDGRGGCMKRRVTLGLVAALAALAVGFFGQAQAAGPGNFRLVTIGRNGTILVRALPARSPAGLAHVRRPVMRLTDKPSPGPPSQVATTLTTSSTATTGSTEEVLSSFAGASLDQQLALGSDQFVTPPDAQIAAGPSQVVEMVNSSGSVWDKQGHLLKLFDLNLFFKVPTGYSFSDPRVLFDQVSQRWFASGVAFIPPTYASVVVIAVSASTDATGTWYQYAADNSSTLTHDQPKIGVSSDKVVLSWNDFYQAAFFEGQSTWVLQKSQMVAGSTPVNGAAMGPDSSRSSPVPAVQITPNSDEYVVFNGTDCGTLGGNCIGAIGVVRISGTPLQGNVMWNESDPGLAATSAPPSADQPGMAGSIATNDDRFLTAVWENGVLWTGGNDACLPPADNAARPCSRLIQVTTAGPNVAQNFDIAMTGGGLFYPALGMDLGADMYVVYNISSASQYIGVRITGQLASAPVQTVAPGQTIRSGDTSYDMNPCFGTNQTSRWGDYSGAAIDPQNATDVWVSAEFAAVGSSANGDAGCDWATYAARLTFAAPTVSGISPSSGSVGTVVSVAGTDFTQAASVSFGSTPATSVSVLSANQLNATAPSGSGTLDVSVTTADGTSATSTPDQFTYVAACSTCATLSSISPTSGPAAGGTTVTFSGSGFDPSAGMTTFSFGGTAATSVNCSNTTVCTGTSPAGSGTVTVTAIVDGVAASGAATFTYLPPASLTSVSPTSGAATGGTTVTFTGSGFDTTSSMTTFSFGGAPATGVSCSSSTTCTGSSPAGIGSVTVTATVDGAPAGGSATFSYIPWLSSISPSTGTAAGGTTVTITGSGFDTTAGKTTFSFGSGTATSVVCSSTTSCTVVTPAGSGVVSVVGMVDGQQSSNSLSFRYRKK